MNRQREKYYSIAERKKEIETEREERKKKSKEIWREEKKERKTVYCNKIIIELLISCSIIF